MAKERLCRIEMLRHAPDRPMVAFFRFFDAKGDCVLTFPFRLEQRVTYFNEVTMDPTLTVEVDFCEPEARVSVRVTPHGWRYRWGRTWSRMFARRKSEAPSASRAQCVSRIVPWTFDGGKAEAARPLVSIVIPTRDQAGLLARAVETLFEKSTWRDKELVIVDNGSEEAETFRLFDRLRGLEGVKIIRRDEPFNFSRLVNAGARAARGDVLALLNNDVETDDPDWLAPLTALALDPRVGVVGAKLLHADGTVQHAGIALGIRGFIGHAGRGRAAADPGPGGMLTTTRRVSAVTGACILTRRDVFEALGGLDEDFVVECNDIDYCLRAGAAGLAVVCAAKPTLVHKEGSTRQARPLRAQEVRDRALFVTRWGGALVDDPYYPLELTLADESLALADEPRHAS